MTATSSAPIPIPARSAAALLLPLALALLPACTSDWRARPTSSMTEAEIAERWASISTPGEQHAHLARMEGDWHARITAWREEGAEPEVSEGFSRNRMMMGGRFLRSEFLGDTEGLPLEGVSLMGYDNSRGEYVSTWYESSSTAIAPLSYGHGDGHVFTFETPHFRDPLSGLRMHLTQVITIVSPDEHVYELYTSYRGQPRYKSLEIVYTRVVE